MTATSVTGIGLGAAVPNQKGSEHLSIGVEKLIGPRIMAADEVTLDGGGDATVILPLLDGAVTDYIVTATSTDTSGNDGVTADLAFNADDTTITVKGAASDTVNWQIVKKGLAV